LSASDPELRRVCVHAGPIVVDLALPALVPVATLIPSIIDILDGQNANPFATTTPARYHLSSPGSPALTASTTLAQNNIRDGAVLVLTRSAAKIPTPRCDDVAEAVSATLDGNAPTWSRRAARVTGAVAAGCITGIGCLVLVRNTLSTRIISGFGTAVVAAMASVVALSAAALSHRACRDPLAGLTLGVVAAAFAAVAGLLAVPGPVDLPHVLLAAMTAAVTSVLAMRVTGCGEVTFTALSCFAVAVAAAALAGVIIGVPLHVVGSVSALLSLGMLEAAARLSIALSGLSPHLTGDLTAKSVRADNWLTSLLAAFAASAAAGAIVTALAGRGTARWGCVTLAALTGALLLLRAFSQIERRRTLVLIVSGIATAGTTFAVAASGLAARGPWIAAATALSAAAAIYLGFVAPTRLLSPVARRGVEVLECLTLAAMVPLNCWICGLYSAVRGLDLM
jgi:type VII secretion integral membrane protein EccD